MKRIFTLLLMLAALSVAAQPYNNEWIRFNQTYYKFKVAKEGLMRIPKTVLDAVNLGNTQVQNFELWRNGEKVPFYASVTSGTLPSNGYLEFWAQPNDGKPDKAMYREPAFQHTDKYSLISDTAVYFLSVNTDQSGIRYVDVVNNVGGPVPPVEPYFMYTAGNYFKGRINQGFAVDLKEYLYSSSYDRGEYWSSSEIYPASNYITTLTNLAVYAPGPDATLRFGASGNALNPRTVKAAVNSVVVKETVMDYFNDLTTTATFPASQIASGNAAVHFMNGSPVATDRMVVSYFAITYPREFKFGFAKNFRFTLPAKGAGYFLAIREFTYGSTPPVLYDMASGERYVGNITTTPGSILFALPGSSATRDLLLVSEEADNIATVSSLTAKTFIDYGAAANQGDYLIISHPSLYVGTTGNNPVNDYKVYRESQQGGSHKVIVADIDELVDQFAFGIKKHPLSVRNFIRYARANWSSKHLEDVFLIGRGMTYYDYYWNQANANADKLNIVPTFGIPASDNLLSSATVTSPVPVTPIGRLSVVHGKEIEDYLEKVKEYENAQKNAPNTLAGRAWMKNIVQVTGASESYLGTVLCNYMGVYKQIIEDTLFGAHAYNFCKVTAGSAEQSISDQIANLFKEGISILNYFGHSSATTLEFNLDNPQAYENQGKYPVFYVNGCNAGNFFTYYPQRLVANETLSEKFVLAKQRGSIAFVASTHYGIVNYLNLFLTNLYGTISKIDYNKTLGETSRDAFQLMQNSTGTSDFYTRLHMEQITLHGDPVLRINAHQKPDYVVEESLIRANPTFISLAETHFELKARFVNLGRSTNDSVVVQVKQQYPNGSTAILYREKIRPIRYSDSLAINVPIVATRDKGTHIITVTVDDESVVDEVAEDNNTATKTINIYQDEARPAFPYNMAVVKDPAQKLYASTANPFSAVRDYVIEIDTTESFNSADKRSRTISSAGGLIEFDPQLSYTDSSVYYWRISPIPVGNGSYQWANHSFMFRNNMEGFNQSHVFQQEKSQAEHMYIDENTRNWVFGLRKNQLFVRNCIYQTGAGNCNQESEFSITINDDNSRVRSACAGNSLVFNVLDSVTFKPWSNVDANNNNLHRFGSRDANCSASRKYNFEFQYLTAAERKLMMDFMDSIPKGAYVIVRSFDANIPNSLSATWRADTALYGSDNSLYHKLLEAGFVDVDSINKARSWILVYKKGENEAFIPRYKYSDKITDRITILVDCYTPDTLGYVTSPMFGPAIAWNEVRWNGKSLEQPSSDNMNIQVIGITPTFSEIPLYTLDENSKQLDLTSVNAAEYPYMKLKMRNADSVKLTPYQLDYWRVDYKPAPEGAMAPNVYLDVKDTVEVGEVFKFGIAFKNFSKYDFLDSVSLKVTITDNNNVPHTINISRQKILKSGDTITVKLDIPSKDYTGHNTLYVEVNPDNAQPEQYHFNNFLYRDFYVRADNTNPFLDVTFDGIHILNDDIVSAKPHIQIRLKDEAKHLLLNDTSLLSVEVRYPNNMTRLYKFDGDTLRFTPATSGTDNSAVLDFTPAFINQVNPEGDLYELIVKGRDRSGNKAGTEYRVSFKVINKPMISNLLNYPNPFSTSTAFVFTITGSEIPQNLKIQILTVTGKIVREITVNELGPLRIGRNITEFKWDGADQYGQKLANGVYLYRVVTNLNGRTMDKFRDKDDKTDKFFTNGYGKMYLMR